MLYIVSAMHCEAKPLIREFGLRRDDSARFFEIYRNDEKMLVISGVGKMRSAVATAHILSRIEPTEDSAIINIGTCGSISEKLPIGAPVLINKIKDGETGREYYPDMLIPHIPMEQGSLETHNRVMSRFDVDLISKTNNKYPKYVDMEASGFFQAAERFIGPHQIYVIKVVSDFLDDRKVDKAYIRDCMEKALPKLKLAIDKILELCCKEVHKEIFTGEDKRILEDLIEHLRLTKYQTHELYDMARAFKIRTGDRLPNFAEIMGMDVKTKQESKMLFIKISKMLTTIKEQRLCKNIL